MGDTRKSLVRKAVGLKCQFLRQRSETEDRVLILNSEDQNVE